MIVLPVSREDALTVQPESRQVMHLHRGIRTAAGRKIAITRRFLESSADQTGPRSALLNRTNSRSAEAVLAASF